MAVETAESTPATETQTDTQNPGNQDAESQVPANETQNTEDSSTSDQSESGPAEADGSDKSSTSSEDANQSDNSGRQKGSNAEKRIKQLTAKLKALENQINTKDSGAKPEEKPLVEPKKPNISEFDDLGKYEEAFETFTKEHADYVAEKTRRETAEQTRREKQEAEVKKLKADIAKREAKTMERNPEYDRNEAYQTVQPSQIMDNFFAYSELGPDVLWELHENPDEAERIRALPFWNQAEELIEIKNRLDAQIKGIQKPVKKTTPSYVSDTGSNPPEKKSLADLLYK